MKVIRCIVVASAVLLGACETPPSQKGPGTAIANRQSPGQSRDFFTVGSSMDEVASLMGTPSSISHALDEVWWYYGMSRIAFRNGRVFEWDNYEKNLKVRWNGSTPIESRADPGQTVTFPKPAPDVGSSSSFPPLPGPDARQIDAQVTALLAGEHSPLPRAVQVQADPSSRFAQIATKNDTQYNLTILLSGPTSRSLVLPPHGAQSIVLAVGTYRVAAKVDEPSVLPFAGTDEILGGDYDDTFYIETVPK
jgi:hypothetical protein